jgi:hypothetical protein
VEQVRDGAGPAPEEVTTMKQYMLSVHHTADETVPSEAEMQEMFAAVEAFNVFAGGLQPPDVATVVRAGAGDVLTTDGPFAETKEQLGGFWVIKAEDLDEALRWATKGSEACRGPVEVRPFQDDAED